MIWLTMMKKIVLVCAGGMSTGVLVNNMKKAAQEKGEAVAIDAFSIESVTTAAKDADCVLLGPQVSCIMRSYLWLLLHL